MEIAQSRGHALTLFNRGKTNPHLFPNIEKLHGDRKTGELGALEGRSWDVVVDTSADPPVATMFAAQPLALDAKHVVTSQVVGQEADLTLNDYERTKLATVTGGLPAGGVLDGDDVVVASIDGVMSRFGEVSATPGDPANIRPTLFIHQRCGRLIETLPALQHDPNRPEDVLKVDADEEGVGGDDAADALRYLVATKARTVTARKLRGL